jgi:Na+-transporting NADH:ubiquinone oxidoreductase subunit NqrF
MPTKLAPKKSLNTNIDEIISDLKKLWELTIVSDINKRILIRQIKLKLESLKK